ncbi:kunitz/Bovine pancreatic trypsin inhibitor domain-containing protein [Ditylenchus destructor]|nr:kunitz/Bovine pancreatic trypsin inhibitor domain-containing protein [Ditylenchus destructor]
MIYVPALMFAHMPDPPVFSGVTHYPSICYLPPDSGLCSADKQVKTDSKERERPESDPFFSIFPIQGGRAKNESSMRKKRSYFKPSQQLATRYYFDLATEQCYPFGTQNCGGNDNRFDTLTQCQTMCRLLNKDDQ